jgi:tripartite-type tricarboxylate transporter receptor subunit TctC
MRKAFMRLSYQGSVTVRRLKERTMKSFVPGAAILLMGCIGVAFAQGYPIKSIRLIVPYPPGGGTDLAARLIGQKLTESLGRTVIVENRAGANGNIGTDAMAKAAPDGYTLGMATPGPVTAGKSLYPTLPYDPERDLAPVILVNASPNVLAVHPSVPARSVKQLVALAKARPLHMGASTIASVQHLLAEMFNLAAGVRMEIITYKGGAQAATDVVGGQVEALWSVLPVVLPFVQSGRLRVLAVASEKRTALLPQVLTMGESGWPTVVAIAWNGVVAPAGTPKSVIDLLNAEIGRSLQAPAVKERFTASGMEAIGGTPEEFGAFLRAETAKWANVIKSANIKVE